MFKLGFKFKVVKNGIIGVIDGVTRSGVYSVSFYEDNELCYQADVHEGTITGNLNIGTYKEL